MTRSELFSKFIKLLRNNEERLTAKGNKIKYILAALRSDTHP